MDEQEVGASEEIVRSDFVGHQTLPHREQPACWALSFQSRRWLLCGSCALCVAA